MVLAEDLRQAVLQAALQGKLTEQLETDSNVDEFIELIKNAKKDLVNLKEIKKELLVSEIDEEDELCKIPNNWRFEKLGNLFYIERGASPRPISAYITSESDGVNWIKIGDADVGEKYINSTKEKITKEGALKSRSVKVGDFIISNSMSFGRPYIVNIDGCIHDGWNVIHNIHAMNCNIEEFNQDYLYYVLSSAMLKQQIIDKAEGGVVKNIKSDNLRDLIIPIPPIEEQKRIVDKINEIMPKIDEYEKIEKELEVLKKAFPGNMKDAILQAAMQGKLTEQVESDANVDEMLLNISKDKEDKINSGLIKKDGRLFINIIDDEDIPLVIPNSWRGVTLGSIVYKLTDGTHKTPKYATNGVKFVSVKDMSSGKLDLDNTKFIRKEEHDELYKRCNPEKGDLLLSKVGTTGVPAIIDTDEEFSLFVSVALIKYNHQYINEKFLYYLIMSPLVQGQVKENTRGIGNKNWVLDFIAKTIIVLPPIEEQQRIVERLDVLLPLCEACLSS